MLKFNRSGTFQIQEAEGVQLGTKIVIHLKTDCREYADDQTIQGTIYNYLLDNLKAINGFIRFIVWNYFL